MSQLRWAVFASAIVGVALGLGGYTFVYADGASYASDAPEACANCHIMSDHYAAWMKSSHSDVATCNDCHTADGAVSKYISKATSGFRHSAAFTTGGYPDRLVIKESGLRVTEQACRNCHEQVTVAIRLGHGGAKGDHGDGLSCVRCHADVGHWVR